MRPGRGPRPARPRPAGPPRLGPHVQDGQPGARGPLLTGARARGPAVVLPGGLAFQPAAPKRALTAVTQLPPSSDVGASEAAGKPHCCPREWPARWPRATGRRLSKQPGASASRRALPESPHAAQHPEPAGAPSAPALCSGPHLLTANVRTKTPSSPAPQGPSPCSRMGTRPPPGAAAGSEAPAERCAWCWLSGRATPPPPFL